MSWGLREGPQPRRVGKYRLLMPLGSGGMATVYLALALGPRDVKQLVVIKVPRGDFAFDPEHRARFLDEARLAARLVHPHLVQASDVFEHEGVPHLVMEHLEGQPLRRLTRWAFEGVPERSLPHRLRALADALAGLHHAHELCDFDGTPLNVVHRDVAPENVFVTYEGRAKVVDFGVAKAVGARHRTDAGEVNGRIAYMAPEQLAGGAIDRRADVFSAGAMLWEELTGRPLWGDLALGEIAGRLALHEVPRPRDERAIARTPLLRICERALAPLPGDRYETADQMRRDLEAVLRAWGQPVSYAELGALLGKAFERERATRRRRIESLLAHIESAPEWPKPPASPPAPPRRLAATRSNPAYAAPPPAPPRRPAATASNPAYEAPPPALPRRLAATRSNPAYAAPPPAPPDVAPPPRAPIEEGVPTRVLVPARAPAADEEIAPTRVLAPPAGPAADDELVPTRPHVPAPPDTPSDEPTPTPPLPTPPRGLAPDEASPKTERSEGLAAGAAPEGRASAPPSARRGQLAPTTTSAAPPRPSHDVQAKAPPLEAPAGPRRTPPPDARVRAPHAEAPAGPRRAPPPDVQAKAPPLEAPAGVRRSPPMLTLSATTLASLLVVALLAGALLSRCLAPTQAGENAGPAATATAPPLPDALGGGALPRAASSSPEGPAPRGAADAGSRGKAPPLVHPHSLPPAPAAPARTVHVPGRFARPTTTHSRRH
ncbi:MAG TPA: protein kinase [Polyangiaceae bacterium]|nr:protein kinase [Polyangiaceae bacterium]